MESSTALNIKFDGSNSTTSTTGFNSAWSVKSNLFAKPLNGAGDTYENINGISFDGNILPNFKVNWSTNALRVDLGRTNLASNGGSMGTPINSAPFASGMLAVGAPGSPATFTSNGPDLFINSGAPGVSISLRPNGAGSTVGEAVVTTTGFKMNAGAILMPTTYSTLPICDAATAGLMRWITDSAPVTYNADITAGGGTTSLIAFCNGASWTAH